MYDRSYTYLSIPEMGGQEVGSITELDCDYLMHVSAMFSAQ